MIGSKEMRLVRNRPYEYDEIFYVFKNIQWKIKHKKHKNKIDVCIGIYAQNVIG